MPPDADSLAARLRRRAGRRGGPGSPQPVPEGWGLGVTPPLPGPRWLGAAGQALAREPGPGSRPTRGRCGAGGCHRRPTLPPPQPGVGVPQPWRRAPWERP
eukprot:12467090-Alexandrium_andersonii.AAC.1